MPCHSRSPSLAAHPAVGVQGRNFTFSVEWNFSVWSGVAELNVNVSGPGGAGTFAANYYNWQAGIDYKMSIMCATKVRVTHTLSHTNSDYTHTHPGS